MQTTGSWGFGNGHGSIEAVGRQRHVNVLLQIDDNKYAILHRERLLSYFSLIAVAFES